LTEPRVAEVRPLRSIAPGQFLYHRFARAHEVRMIASRIAASLFALVLIADFVAPARAQPVADFYRGKSITMLIGYTSGGGYDLYARVLSRHMPKHIPGNPAMVPQNM